MKKQDAMAILITFSTGLIAGAYLYLVGFAPQLEKVSNIFGGGVETREEAEESYADFLIIGERYGGCERGDSCDSFQLTGDGRYSYLPTPVTAGGEPETGEIPRSLMRDLRQAVTRQNLRDASETIVPDTCDSYIDQSDYRYDITLDTVVYDIDTCGTTFSHYTQLGEELENLWIYFRTGREG